ncbi:MAG TPA: DNA polymerase IV [Wenzhouxiangellaceae bacterium]|nr:DNA polymerase IV [Wenzhouxiangellaceae bacterium]
MSQDSDLLSAGRVVFHCDMDAFFASVEQRDRPELRGKAVIVGGDGRRGVVAAASYEARRYGVYSAMPAGRARRLCPHAVFVRPRHALYREVSRAIFEIFADFSSLVEGLSLDEAFIDMTEASREGDVLELARRLKRRISVDVSLTASIGIGNSKLVAKLASAYDKPDGLTWIRPGQVQQFLDPQPVRRLPGVGPSTGARLQDAGILTIGQLRRAPLDWLVPVLGRQALGFRQRSAGIDERAVSAERTRRSISQESTFERDLHDMSEIEEVIGQQASRCAAGLSERGLYARSVHLKLRSGGFSTLTRSRTLPGYTRSPARIAEAAVALANEWARYQARVGVRLIGVGVAALESRPDPGQLLPGDA